MIFLTFINDYNIILRYVEMSEYFDVGLRIAVFVFKHVGLYFYLILKRFFFLVKRVFIAARIPLAMQAYNKHYRVVT